MSRLFDNNKAIYSHPASLFKFWLCDYMSDLFLQRTAGPVVTHMNGIMVEDLWQRTHMNYSHSSSRRGSVSPVSLSGYVTSNWKTFKIITTVVVVINDNVCFRDTASMTETSAAIQTLCPPVLDAKNFLHLHPETGRDRLGAILLLWRLSQVRRSVVFPRSSFYHFGSIFQAGYVWRIRLNMV